MRKLVVVEMLSLDGVMQGPGDPDEDRGGGEPELHDREEGVAAREELGVLAVLLEQLDGVVHRLGDLVVEG